MAPAPMTTQSTVSTRRSHPAEADVLAIQIFVEPIVRALRTEAALLDAAERRDLGRDQTFIDPDHAVFETFGHPPAAALIAAVEIGSQPERRIVGQTHGLVFIVESVLWRYRSDGLLMHRHRFRRYVCQHRGRAEQAAVLGRSATDQH